MKIGMITYHKVYNYGSVLQAFALNRYLRSICYDAEVINYHTTGHDKLYAIFEKPISLKALARNLQSLIYYRALKIQKKRFNTFLKTRITLGQQEFTEHSDLSGLKDCYQIFVCGSDQIWNPRCGDFSPAYLLDFVEDKRSCVAYAPSIGTDILPSDFERTFSSSIRNFKALSLREKSTIDYVARLIEREITCVPDPVLLLSRDEWLDLTAPRLIREPYIFCCFIGDVDGMRSFARSMHRKTGFPLVVVYKNLRDMFYPNKKCYTSGPEEFLSLIIHCDYVCTNSFHTVLFSLLFQKNFWVFTSLSEGSAKSRIESILDIVGLSNRILNCITKLPKDPTIPIDFSGIPEILSDLAHTGKSFLQNSLKDI